MAVTDRQQSYLDAMGIQVWRSRQSVKIDDVAPTLGAEANEAKYVGSDGQLKTSVDQSIVLKAQQDDWPQLAQRVASCSDCVLSESRTQAVFGIGDKQADWMVIGDVPGIEEDQQGEPFVDAAGQLLSKMLLAIGLKREQVFLTNILKCSPSKNSDSSVEELDQCQAYLHRQIELLQPKIILVMGQIAAQQLLKLAEPLDAMRGKQFDYGDTEIPVVVTYHPSDLLQNPAEKSKAWQDLQFAEKRYAQFVHGKVLEK